MMDETTPFSSAAALPPEILTDPMEFLSRSWSAAAVEVSRAISPSVVSAIPEDAREEEAVAGNPFSFASSATSQLILERIMSQSQQDVSPLTSGRPSHSSGPLSDSPPVSPSDLDDLKLCRASNTPRAHYRGGSRTVGRWLKDRRERRKEETRAQNAQLHAAISVAGLAAAVASIASATAAASAAGGNGRTARADAAVASAATLVAAQCVEAAESLGAERDHLASVVSSAVSVRTAGDVATLTAAAATALRGAATLKARVLKEVWNMAAVIPVEKGEKERHDSHHRRRKDDKKEADEEAVAGSENFVGLYSQELLARGIELLKRTRKGDLHWKLASVYIDRTGRVLLKTKSRHVAGTITKKKKEVVVGVCRDVAAWPGRHLLEGAEERRYLGLRTAEGRVIEFEFRGQREYDMFTAGVCRLLDMVRDN